jgi:iron complex outermembrane recepter protein
MFHKDSFTHGERVMPKNRLLHLAVIAALPVSGYAQEQSGGLEEIVVTAERREASLQTVPVPVTAITAEALENKQVTEARDLARYAPSLKMFNNITTPTNLSPSLRGSLQQDASLVVAESPFGIYVDDVYLARLNGNNVTLADIERVEVLRGPQGTLYGRNTLAGAIKFMSRNPGEESWLNASAGAGNFDQYRLSFSAGGPISDDGWAGSFSAFKSYKGPQFYSVHPSKNEATGKERNWALRGKLRYTGIENLDVTLSVSHADALNDGGQLIPAQTPTVPANRQFSSDDLVPQFGDYVLNTPEIDRPNGLRNYPLGTTKQTIGSLNIGYDFGDMVLRSITGYVKTKDYFTNDFSGNGNIEASNEADAEQFSEELQLSGTGMNGKLNYLVGVYLFREEAVQAFAWNSYFPGVFPILPISNSLLTIDTSSISAFTQFDYQVTDALKLTLGYRYTEDDKDFRMIFNGVTPLPFVPATGLVEHLNTYSEGTGRLGLDYTVPTESENIDRLLIYASAAEGFKSGGYNGIAIFNFNDALSPYTPENNTTYEVGVKSDLFNNRLRVNANYFISDTDDLTLNAQVIVDGLATFPVTNAGKAQVKGLEVEITAVPTDGLTLFLSGTGLMDGKFKSLNPTSAPANSLASYGVSPIVPQTPDFSVSFGFDYRFDTALGEMTVGADWFQTDDYVTSATQEFLVKAHGFGNAFVALQLSDSLSLRGSVKNFTDEYVLQTGSRGFLGGFIPNRPREYLFSVNYSMN